MASPTPLMRKMIGVLVKCSPYLTTAVKILHTNTHKSIVLMKARHGEANFVILSFHQQNNVIQWNPS